jgi:ubiquinone/menaquinone biosynthesis C-methylase UbiE
MGTILDVGCGNEPHGDVNMDLYRRENIHRKGNINIRKIPDFILADCHYLPFKDASFEIVFCSHVLEHKGINLKLVCEELLRVAKKQVMIRVPSVLARYYRAEGHATMFVRETFKKLFRDYNVKVKYNRQGWQHAYFPNKYVQSIMDNRKIKRKVWDTLYFFPCPIPTEIEVKILK